MPPPQPPPPRPAPPPPPLSSPAVPSASSAAAKKLHHLLRSRDLCPALSYLRSLPSPFTLLPNHALNALLRALAAAGRIRAAAALFRRLPSPTPHSFNSLLAALLRRGRRRNASALLASFLRSPYASPDAATLNTLVHGLSTASASASASTLLRLFKFLPERYGFVPDAISYNSLLAAMCCAGDLAAARKLFDGMRERKVSASAATDEVFDETRAREQGFTDVLDEMRARKHCASENTMRVDHHLASEMHLRRQSVSDDTTCLLDEMPMRKESGRDDAMPLRKHGGDSAFPNVITYTTMIRGYCAKRLPNEALAVFKIMIADGVAPNRITYNTLVQGFCDAGRMELVKEVLEMGSFRPDTCTFNTLIAAHCRMGQLRDAMKVFNQMAELRVKRDSASYSTMIRALCENGEFGQAEELVDELLEKEVFKKRGGCVPVIAAYNPLFVHLCENGKSKKARILFGQLLDRRSKVDFPAFKTLILGHCREGDFEEGYQLVVSMLKRDLVPDDESYIAVIDGFLQKGKMKFAWEALRRMLNSGLRPSTSTFHSVLLGLLKKDGCAKEAGDLVEVMLERKIRQNVDLSTNTIDALFKSGLNDHAYKIVTSLYDKGYYIKMEKLVGSLCEEKKFIEAMELTLFSMEKRQNLGLAASSLVLDGLCVTGRASEAFRLYYELVENKSAPAATAPRSLVALHHALEEAGKMKEADFVAKQMRRASTRIRQKNTDAAPPSRGSLHNALEEDGTLKAERSISLPTK